jgi:hypothetical protein
VEVSETTFLSDAPLGTRLFATDSWNGDGNGDGNGNGNGDGNDRESIMLRRMIRAMARTKYREDSDISIILSIGNMHSTKWSGPEYTIPSSCYMDTPACAKENPVYFKNGQGIHILRPTY